VAQYAVEKVNHLGGKAVTLSDSSGTIVDMDGIKGEKWDFVMQLKNIRRGRIHEYADKFGARYHEGKSVWDVIRDEGLQIDVALPSATQNEIQKDHAEALIKNGCFCLSEGANMPSTPGAIEVYQDKEILYGPGKAANAGGVAVSGLEMSQNSLRMGWAAEEVDNHLQRIMKNIHKSCLDAADTYGSPGNYVVGANIAGFLKVARSMLAFGVI